MRLRWLAILAFLALPAFLFIHILLASHLHDVITRNSWTSSYHSHAQTLVQEREAHLPQSQHIEENSPLLRDGDASSSTSLGAATLPLDRPASAPVSAVSALHRLANAPLLGGAMIPATQCNDADAKLCPCVALTRVLARQVPWAAASPQPASAGLPLGWAPAAYSAAVLTLDPARRATGLPLRLRDWPLGAVFVVAAVEPGRGHRASMAEIDKRFHEAGLRFTQAVWPLHVDEVFAAKYRHLLPHSPSSPRPADHELRLLLAHVEVWSRVVAQRRPFALVVEDDAGLPGARGGQAEAAGGRRGGGGGASSRGRTPDAGREASASEVHSNVSWRDWKNHFEMVLRELNLLLIQRGTRFFFDLLLLSRHPLAAFAEPRLTTHIRQAQPSQGVTAYLLSYKGAKRLLSSIRLTAPLSEALAAVPSLTLLAAEPPVFLPPPLSCRPQPCRPLPSPSFRQQPLSRACGATVLLGLPGHPRLRSHRVGADWQAQAQRRAGAHPTILVRGDSHCGTPAHCLLQQLPAVESTAPPRPVPLIVALLMPPALAMWEAFVVSLPEDGERFRALEPQLRQHGFGRVTRALGIGLDASDFGLLQHLVAADRLAHTRNSPWWQEKGGGEGRDRRQLSKGEVGCALSHYFVWYEVIRRNLPFAIVLEDDVQFTSAQFRGEFERNVGEANYILQQRGSSIRPHIVFLGKADLFTSFYTPHLSQHVVQTPLVWCSFAYIISLEGAKLLTHNFLLNDPLDSYWWHVPGLRFWSFEPNLANHQSGSKKASDKHFSSRVQWTGSQW